MTFVLQLLVLALTATLWWVARRDLSARAVSLRPPASEDWERLRMTVEQLMAELERRAIVAEQRIVETEARLLMAEHHVRETLQRASASPAAPMGVLPPLSAEPAPAPMPNGALPPPAVLEEVAPPAPVFVPPPAAHLSPAEAHYAPIHALADAGETDAAEIARQTGISRGEVDLVLSLRGRRMA